MSTFFIVLLSFSIFSLFIFWLADTVERKGIRKKNERKAEARLAYEKDIAKQYNCSLDEAKAIIQKQKEERQRKREAVDKKESEEFNKFWNELQSITGDSANKTITQEPKISSAAVTSISCPKCYSSQIYAGKKGYGLGKAVTGAVLIGVPGLLGGFIGKDAIILTCLKCGNKWKVKKNS